MVFPQQFENAGGKLAYNIIPRLFLYTMHIEIATLVCSKDVRAEFLCEKMRVSLSFFIKNQSTIRDFYDLIYLHVEFDKCENTKLRPAYPLKRS